MIGVQTSRHALTYEFWCFTQSKHAPYNKLDLTSLFLCIAYPFRGLQFDTQTIPRQHLNCFWCRLLCIKWKNLHLMSAYSDFSVWCYQLSTCLCGLWPKVSSRHRHVSYRSMSSPAPFRPDWLCTLHLGTGRQFAFPETKDDDKNVPL